MIIGAGVMGRMHLEMAMRFRPRHLIISDLVQDRLDKALKAVEQKGKELGIAVAAVQADELGAFVRCLTDGAGAGRHCSRRGYTVGSTTGARASWKRGCGPICSVVYLAGNISCNWMP